MPGARTTLVVPHPAHSLQRSPDTVVCTKTSDRRALLQRWICRMGTRSIARTHSNRHPRSQRRLHLLTAKAVRTFTFHVMFFLIVPFRHSRRDWPRAVYICKLCRIVGVPEWAGSELVIYQHHTHHDVFELHRQRHGPTTKLFLGYHRRSW